MDGVLAALADPMVLVMAMTAFTAWIVYTEKTATKTKRERGHAILFEGNIASGKTTLVHYYSTTKTDAVEGVPEFIGTDFLHRFYAEPQTYGFALQMARHAHRATLLRSAVDWRTDVKKNLLLDRSILGDYAFALWNTAIGNMSPTEWALYREQAGASVKEALERHIADPASVTIVFLNAPAAGCIERQRERDAEPIDETYERRRPPFLDAHSLIRYMYGIEAAHLVVMACVPREYRVVELQWHEYTDNAADDTVPIELTTTADVEERRADVSLVQRANEKLVALRRFTALAPDAMAFMTKMLDDEAPTI